MPSRDPNAAPRVLSVRFGFNPNSSSLGIDVSFLLLGLGGVAVLTAALTALLGATRAPPAPAPIDTPPRWRPTDAAD